MKFSISALPLRAPGCNALFFKLFAAVLVFACPFAPLASAQATGGSIIGKVSEWHGGPLAGARITVTNTQTHAATSVATDVNGEFTAENLPAGDYKVTIAASGLVPEDKIVKVKSGHKSKLSATIKPPAPPTPK
ncbi:MAG TPA: carboxypeptidase-like regulatory domain-containing protein [Candidatus Acidoferrales bacterium]|nr:carboxypeptidase-like regulatory domain-containing protein [Candidatus Acidoferrales bacterium]